MIFRTPVSTVEVPAPAGPRPLRVLAVGRLAQDTREVRAASLLQPRKDVIEHRVTYWPGRGWVAEVRVNLALLHRSLFSRASGYDDALAWCNAVAPQATQVQSARVDVAATLAENERLREAARAEAAAVTEAFGLTSAVANEH